MSQDFWDIRRNWLNSGGGSQTLTPTGSLPSAPSGTLIPNQSAIDNSLSSQIAGLINPPSVFADTSRQAGELAAARGVSGSAAAYGTSLRMTDEERLKRISLGEQLASSMSSRNQPNVITPFQQAQLALQQQQLKLQQEQASREASWQSFQQTIQGGRSSTPNGFYRNMYGQLVGQNTGQIGHNYTRSDSGWGW